MPTRRPKDEDLDEVQPADSIHDDVVFDLDEINEETPDPDRLPPFLARIGGETVELRNPDDIPWQTWETAITSGSSYQLLGAMMSNDDAEIFFRQRSLKSAALKRLIEAWQEHYDIDPETMQPRGNRAANRAERRAMDRQRPRRGR